MNNEMKSSGLERGCRALKSSLFSPRSSPHLRLGLRFVFTASLWTREDKDKTKVLMTAGQRCLQTPLTSRHHESKRDVETAGSIDPRDNLDLSKGGVGNDWARESPHATVPPCVP